MPGDVSAWIYVSWSTSLTPPKEPQFAPLYPSKDDVVVLYLTFPCVSEPLSEVVPTGNTVPPSSTLKENEQNYIVDIFLEELNNLDINLSKVSA